MPPMVEDINKPSCVMCEFFMSRVKEWLNDGHTVDELENDMKMICGILPGSVTVNNLLTHKTWQMYLFLNHLNLV